MIMFELLTEKEVGVAITRDCILIACTDTMAERLPQFVFGYCWSITRATR